MKKDFPINMEWVMPLQDISIARDIESTRILWKEEIKGIEDFGGGGYLF